MKYHFVLDENLLYLGIKGVDERGNKDTSTAQLLLSILKNCHKIVVDKELNRRFKRHLKALEKISRSESVIPGMDIFIRNLLQNKDKIIWHFLELEPAPDEPSIPKEDIHIVRIGYHFKAKVITADKELAEAISDSETLEKNGVTALSPRDALELARES